MNSLKNNNNKNIEKMNLKNKNHLQINEFIEKINEFIFLKNQ